MRFTAVGFAILLSLSAFPATGQDVAQQPALPARTLSPRADDEEAIRANDDAFVKAYNAGDAKGLVATFTNDAEVVDEWGATAEGRDAIVELFTGLFQAEPGAKITLQTDRLKFLGPDTALVRGRAEVTPAKSSGAAPEVTRYTVVFVKQAGKWLQASVRDELDQDSSHADRLKALEWLVGDWVSENSDAIASTHCDWTEGKAFLLRTFTIQVQGKPAMTGQQRIGWDPLTRQIKSWVFDSEGGHGEAYWSHDGDHWVVKAHGVRRDSRPASATQIITPVNKDMIRWRTVDRTIAGKAAPDVEDFVLVRKPVKPR